MLNFKLRRSFSHLAKPVALGILAFCSLSAGKAQDDFAWLAFGDTRGQIGPCGCDEATNLGGLKRLSYEVEQVRAARQVYVFSLGNNYGVKGDDGARDELIDKALRVVAPTASLFASTEARFFKKPQTPFPGMVLSHVQGHAYAGFVSDTVRVGNVVVLGYSHGLPYTQNFGPPLAKRWQALLQKHRTDRKILLYAGPKDVLEAIQRARLFDEVIAANDDPLANPPSPIEKQQPGRLLFSGNVYKVPSYAQGILRGGVLRQAAPKLNLCLPGNLNCPAPDPFGGKSDLFVWLTPDYEQSSKVDGLLNAWFAREHQNFANLVEKRRAMLPHSPFAGAEACQSCHEAQYQVWKNSRHAHALQTLPHDKQTVAECVECHVLGLKEDGGFVSAQITPGFAGVQCETCHGPRKEHAANPSVKPKLAIQPREVCAGCHKLPHSSHFVFDVYWPKIKH